MFALVIFLAALAGIAFGVWRARQLGAEGFDLLRYGAVHGLLLALVATIALVAVLRLFGGS